MAETQQIVSQVRGTCPACRKIVYAYKEKDGRLKIHNHVGKTRKICPGTGQPPMEVSSSDQPK